ncbi:MAG: hypothetical protein ACR2GH_18790 [Pseudonocardia sp.]
MMGLGWRATASAWRSTGCWPALLRSRRTVGCSRAAFAIDLRLAGRARATKDVDLDLAHDDVELLDPLLDAATMTGATTFVFRIERSGVPADCFGGSQRFRVSVSLAGGRSRRFPSMSPSGSPRDGG